MPSRETLYVSHVDEGFQKVEVSAGALLHIAGKHNARAYCSCDGVGSKARSPCQVKPLTCNGWGSRVGKAQPWGTIWVTTCGMFWSGHVLD